MQNWVTISRLLVVFHIIGLTLLGFVIGRERVSAKIVKNEESCGNRSHPLLVQVKQSTTVWFASPNYPAQYPPKLQCFWLADAGQGYVLKWRISSDFTLSNRVYKDVTLCSRDDYIDVWDGDNISTKPQRICPNEGLLTSHKSSQRYVLVKFVSDGTKQYTGFSIRLESEKEGLAIATIIIIVTCSWFGLIGIIFLIFLLSKIARERQRQIQIRRRIRQRIEEFTESCM